MRISKLVAIVACLICTSLLACETNGGPEAGVERRDSAGIEIVMSGSPVQDQDGGLELGTRPTLRTGQTTGEEPYLFVGPLHALRLRSGRTVVLDEGLDELRWFDASGRHVRTVGGSGEGPGEFVHPETLIRLPGDSVLVFDEAHPRITLYDSAGALARTWSLESPPTRVAGDIQYFRPAPFGRLADGRTLHLASWSEEGTGRVRRTAVVLAFDETGRWLGSLLEFSGGDWWVERIEGGVRSSRGIGDRTALATTDGSRIYVGNGDEYRIRVHGPEGSLQSIVGRVVEPAPADETQVDSVLARMRAEAPALSPEEERLFERRLRERAEQMEEHLAHYETMPAFYGLETDEAGRLWVRKSRFAYDFDLFSSEGRWLGSLLLSGEPLFLGTDEIVVAGADSLGARFVEVFPLTSR